MSIEDRGAALAVIRVGPALRRRLERLGTHFGRATLHAFESLDEFAASPVSPDVVIFDAERMGAEAFTVPCGGVNGRLTPVVALVPSLESANAQECAEAGAHEVFSYDQVGVPLASRLRSLLDARALLASFRNGVDPSTLPKRMRALATTAESVEDRSGGHTARVAALSSDIALRLGADSLTIERIRLAALLHDVGKLTIPSMILKKPARLNKWEFAVVQRHTTDGAAMLGEPVHDALMTARTIAATHHERWDGAGYPDGLSRDSIPLEGRIVAVADVFDALTSDRAYKPAWQVTDALAEIESGAGTQFDPDAVHALTTVSKEPGFGRAAAAP